MQTSALQRAKLLAKEVSVDLTVCFNPKELNVEKTAAWDPTNKVEDEPAARFGPTSPATLAVTLLFDTYEEKACVYKKYTSQLEKLIHVISNSVRRPPYTIFVWGNFCFHGVVESLSQKYTLFIANGTPVRAECVLKMKKARGALQRTDSAPQSPPDRINTYSKLWVGR